MSDEEQVRYLQEANKVVATQSFYMKRAMDGDSLKLALDHATEMLRELRTGLLTPKNYYELYMKILDELRELEEYLQTLQRSGRSMVEVYEQVQCCPAIVPRMYLLCCVGGVYITSKEAPAKDILKDLIEMVKGVQHPMRGLFLRNYLLLVSKNRLPDVGSPYEGIGGGIQDAISFLMQNFVETNRLWVRLQTQGGAKDRKKREKERLDLRILVGANLVRLSQLEGLDVAEYKANILPKVVEEIVGCKDTIAQSYLMDCVIQVFSDDYHLATLQTFLDTIAQLKEKVSVRTILESLMDRLASHCSTTGAPIPSDIPAFSLFNSCIAGLIEERSNMSLTETLRLQTVLTNFALKCYPSRIDYVSHTLTTSAQLLAKTDFGNTSSEAAADHNDTVAQIEALLQSPLSSLSLKVLDMPPYARLMAYLPWTHWSEVAVTLLRSVISMNSPLTEASQSEQLFKTITPLLRDKDGTVKGNSDEENPSSAQATLTSQFKEEQNLVARIPHLMQSDDTDVLLQMLVAARQQFSAGGATRMQFTFPSLIFAALSLARRVHGREAMVATEGSNVTPPQYSTRKVFHFIMEAITSLAGHHAETAMKLFLQAALAADDFNLSAIAYEFVKEGMLLYEMEISDSRAQVAALTLFIGALLQTKHFPSEDYEALITKMAQYSNKLLKKNDQSKMIAMCSLLFHPPRPAVSSEGSTPMERYSDGDRVLECMQRALKIARNHNINLYVDMLDRYLYFFETDAPFLQPTYITGLIQVIQEAFAADPSAVLPATQAHLKNTLAYIRARQEAPDTADKFAAIGQV